MAEQTVLALTPFVGLREAVGPITAIVCPRPPSGRAASSFFSRTLPSSATWRATAWLAGVDTSAVAVVGKGRSKSPAVISARTTRKAAVSIWTAVI